MKMLSVVGACYFSKLKKVVYFLCVSCLGLGYLESSCVFTRELSAQFRVSSVSAVFLPILNTILHKKSRNRLKKFLVIPS